VGPDGDIFTAELRGSVRQYDRRGRFVGTVAQRGQGPTEVGYVVGLEAGPGGRLAIVDFGNQRISVFASNGQLLEQHRRPPGRPSYGRDAIAWDRDGSLWLGLNPPRQSAAAGGDSGRPVYGRLTPDGTIRDTVRLPYNLPRGCRDREPDFALGFLEDSRIPFEPFVQWARGRDGTLVLGCSATYTFLAVRPSGHRLRLTRAWSPALMSRAEHEFWTEYRGPVPRQRPAFLRLWVADDRVWVWPGAIGRPYPMASEEVAAGAPEVVWNYYSPSDGFDVFDIRGHWLGHVRTPDSWAAQPYPGLRDPVFRGDSVWAIISDTLGVSYVSKFVVEWPRVP
jgi:hypothetical protein